MRLILTTILMIFSSSFAIASGWEYDHDVVKIDALGFEIGISEFKHISSHDTESGIVFRQSGSRSAPARLPMSSQTLIISLSIGFTLFILAVIFAFKRLRFKKTDAKLMRSPS